jgi:hypothetical protein
MEQQKTSEETLKKIEAVRKHADAWRGIFEKLQNEKLKQFSGEPLDKKTAIICTSYIVDAIKELTQRTVWIAQTVYPEHHKELEYIDPGDPDGPLDNSDPPRPWIAEILSEICSGGIDDNLVESGCHAFNFNNIKSTTPEHWVDRQYAEIKEHPIPE